MHSFLQKHKTTENQQGTKPHRNAEITRHKPLPEQCMRTRDYSPRVSAEIPQLPATAGHLYPADRQDTLVPGQRTSLGETAA